MALKLLEIYIFYSDLVRQMKFMVIKGYNSNPKWYEISLALVMKILKKGFVFFSVFLTDVSKLIF